MLSTLILYLTQKFETFNYLQKVYGLGVSREINESKLISVYEGNTEQHLNLDTHESFSVFLTNGNKTVEQIESEVVANEYHVKHTYPFKCLIYAKSNENVNCASQSRLIADSIEKSITGRQKALLASTQLVDAYIEVKNTTLEKHTLYANYFTGGGLGNNDILIEIEFDFIVEGNQNCFVDSPCDNDEFVFDFEQPQSFCERVDECLGIPTTNGQYVLTITDEVISWEEFSASGLVDGNGTTINENKVDLGGELIQDTVIDGGENGFKITQIPDGAHESEFEMSQDLFGLGVLTGTGFRYKLSESEWFFVKTSDDTLAGSSHLAAIGYVNLDTNEECYLDITATDISMMTSNDGINTTGININRANQTIQHVVEGALVSLTDGDTNKRYKDNVVVNEFDSDGFMYIGSESVNGSWRFATDSGNLVIQKRVSGSWVTKQTLV